MNIQSKRLGKLFRISFYIVIFIIISYIINKYGLERLRIEVNNLGLITPIALFILRFTSVIIPALPGTAYSLLAGTLLGFKKGLLIICLSDLISCNISFWISRKFGRKFIKRLIGKKFIVNIETISKKHLEDNFFLMTGFLMTGLFDFVSYAVGLSKTPWRKYMPALILSILISNPPIVALGAGLLEGGKKLLILALIGIFALAVNTGRLNNTVKSRKI